jgi:hypothetical protein
MIKFQINLLNIYLLLKKIQQQISFIKNIIREKISYI